MDIVQRIRSKFIADSAPTEPEEIELVFHTHKHTLANELGRTGKSASYLLYNTEEAEEISIGYIREHYSIYLARFAEYKGLNRNKEE